MGGEAHRGEDQGVSTDACGGRALLQQHEGPPTAIDPGDGVGRAVGMIDEGRLGPATMATRTESPAAFATLASIAGRSLV
jgi:hypothetical protein